MSNSSTDIVDAEIVDAEATPTMIDALQTDAAPKEWPADAPGLWPYLKLPFRERAKFYRLFQALHEMEAELAAIDKKRKRLKNPSQELMMTQAAAMYDLFAVMDDLMRIAAVDKDAYDEWVNTHEDDEFQTLFAVYVERSQPGEASGSAG